MSTCRRVTIFSSIPSVVESIQKSVAVNELKLTQIPHLDIIRDASLTGYGGTVNFNPTKLEPSTLETLSRTEILISEPAVVADLLTHHPLALKNLCWLQSTYAGVDPIFNQLLDSKKELPAWRLTRFAGKFGPPIAEWCLARIISQERGFALTAMDQTKKLWAGSNEIMNYRYLSSLTLTILGCGDIGRCIARAAIAFGMRVIGYVHNPRLNDDVLDVHYTTDLKEALQAADYIVSILPSTPGTRGMLLNNVLSSCAVKNGGKSPVLLNVGRGDVISEAELLGALDQDYISAAILDVMETEPLPASSLLWEHPRVVVSPHVSGLTQAKDVPDVFWDNFKRYTEGSELLYQVDWTKGY
eukprot:CAMPEP_0194376068 /NCGR_PEP_ID=MMETSP0174-20130528/24578_1 /TAXON_ID=216777 /ORGANISM="Proboscia alata, Strain PI-D3" /LENGTH=356 /DNA_ID=CAMNT_0039156615 /DNA_START=65 /DNA_END=1135 /DNA_ORIENTATION=+